MCIVAGLVPLLLTELTTPDSAPPAAAVIILAAVVSAAATTAATSASFDSPSRRLAGSAAVALLESAVGVRSAAASAAGGATSAAAWIMKICTERRAHRGSTHVSLTCCVPRTWTPRVRGCSGSIQLNATGRPVGCTRAEATGLAGKVRSDRPAYTLALAGPARKQTARPVLFRAVAVRNAVHHGCLQALVGTSDGESGGAL